MSVRRPVSLRYPRLPHSVQAGTQFVLPVGDPVTGHFALFAVNDILRMKAFNGTAVLDNWMRVDVVTDPGGGADYFRYTCTLMSGTPGTFPKGTAIVNYGQAGAGFILLTSDAAMSPYLDVATHAGSPWASVTPRVRLGNLDGVLGLTEQWGIALGFDLTDVTAAARYIVASDQQVALHNIDLALFNGASQSVELTNAGQLKVGTNISGAATTELYFNPAAATYNGESLAAGTLLLGDNTSGQPNVKVNDTDIRFRRGTTTHLLIDGTNIVVGEVGVGLSNILITAGAINLRTNTTVKISLDTGGNISLTGDLAVGTAGQIRSGATAILTGNGYWLDYNAGTPRFRIGTITGGALDEGIYWDGANIQLYSGTGSFGSPTTGLKIYTTSSIGVIEMWGSGTKQVYMGTDGKFYAGNGNVRLSNDGIDIAQPNAVLNFMDSTFATLLGRIYNVAGNPTLQMTSFSNADLAYSILQLQAYDNHSLNNAIINLRSRYTSNVSQIEMGGTNFAGLRVGALGGGPAAMLEVVGDAVISTGLNVGSATGAGTGDVKASGSIRQSTALGARAFNSAAITLTTATWTVLTFDSERFDNDTIHNTGSNTSRLTAITAGVYVITVNLAYVSNATGNRMTHIRLNAAGAIGGGTGIATDSRPAVNGQRTYVSMATIYNMAANDYVEVFAWQDSGGNLNVDKLNNDSPEFSMVRIA